MREGAIYIKSRFGKEKKVFLSVWGCVTIGLSMPCPLEVFSDRFY